MTLVNDAVRSTPGSGATLATNSPGSGTTEYHVAIPATAAGHLAETEPTYTLQLPLLESSANKYHWELFNGVTSGLTISIRAVYGMASSDTVSTTALSNRFDFFRTTALGSGGTVFRTESASTTSANFSRWDTQDAALPSTVTCKTTLTSITTGSWLFPQYLSTALSPAGRWDVTLVDRMNTLVGEVPDDPGVEFRSSKPLTLRPGEGLAARQGPVASTRSWTWVLQFTAV